MSNQFKLLTERRFAPFFWTQFLGAGNDNLFKFAFTLMVTFGVGHATNKAPNANNANDALTFTILNPALIVQLIGAIFILPFVLFSATAGQLSDKYEKSRLMRQVKNLEIIIMLLGYWGFTTQNIAVLLSCTFLMGVHSTLFGPAKYAYLPQHLRSDELTGGNGMVEMGTFVSILLGTLLGGVLIGFPNVGVQYAATACVIVAVLGRLAAQWIPNSPATEPQLCINWNPLTETWLNLKLAAQYSVVFRCLIGISWLWFFGAVMLTQFPSLAKDALQGDADVATLLLMMFSLGIGLGSLTCELLSKRRVEIGLVPIGALGMTVFGVLLYYVTSDYAASAMPTTLGQFWLATGSYPILVALFFLAFSAGLFSVPLYALIQARSPESHRARIVAANNIINALFMIVSALLVMVLQSVFYLSVPEIILATAILNIVVVSYVFILAPEFVLRFVSYFLAHAVYRFKVKHEANIPTEGACLLVCNHVSFVDVLLLMAASPRPIYFVMDSKIYQMPLLHLLFKAAKAIPIAPRHEHATLADEAFQRAVAHLADGDIVGIFPEGKLTATGNLNLFKQGVGVILDMAAAQNVHPPVVPMALQGLWGSFFSRVEAGKAMAKPFRRGLLSAVTLNVGNPMPAISVTPPILQAAVEALKEGIN